MLAVVAVFVVPPMVVTFGVLGLLLVALVLPAVFVVAVFVLGRLGLFVMTCVGYTCGKGEREQACENKGADSFGHDVSNLFESVVVATGSGQSATVNDDEENGNYDECDERGCYHAADHGRGDAAHRF